MNFHLTPAATTKICQASYDLPVVLLSRIKIGMNEWPAVMIAQLIERLRIFPAPLLQSLLLQSFWSTNRAKVRSNCRLEMIGQGNDEMNSPGTRATCCPLPGIRRQPLKRARYFPCWHRQQASASRWLLFIAETPGRGIQRVW